MEELAGPKIAPKFTPLSHPKSLIIRMISKKNMLFFLHWVVEPTNNKEWNAFVLEKGGNDCANLWQLKD